MTENKDGLFYSPIAEEHDLIGRLLGISEGIVTGMAPGFQLDNLARIDHPAAQDAFFLQEDFFQDSGNVSEAQAVDDFGRVVYLHEPFGFLCDLTARYRSWEGGINAAAMIQYLFGLELDAVNNRIKIAPHLPEDWPEVSMTNARIGDITFDILVQDDGDTRVISVQNTTALLNVDALVSVEGDMAKVEVNGVDVDYTAENQWGRSRVRLQDMSSSPGQSLTITLHR